MVGSGGPAASTFCESLADADAAAPKRLRYARKSVSFFESGNPGVFANDVCMSLFGSCLAEIVQVSHPVFLKLSATECVPWLHGGVFCDFCNKLELAGRCGKSYAHMNLLYVRENDRDALMKVNPDFIREQLELTYDTFRLNVNSRLFLILPQEAKRRNVDQTWVQAWLARLGLQIKVRESAPSLPQPCSRLSLRAFRR